MKTLGRALLLYVLAHLVATWAGAVDMPSAQEHRAGICALNTGQLAREDSSFVRAGNSGWDYGCIWTQLDIGGPGGLWAGVTFAPTILFAWDKVNPDDTISRYSWRPGYHNEETGEKRGHQEQSAYWVIPEVGWYFDTGPVELRPSLGLLWLTDLGYHFGAPWGPATPLVGLDVLAALGPFVLGVNGRLAYKSPHTMTVLEDWAGKHSGCCWEAHEKWITPVEAKVGVVW